MVKEEFKSLFENGITRNAIKAVFNPYSIMKPLNDNYLYLETINELEKGAVYDELKVSLAYSTYFEDDKEKQFEDAIKTFLSYKDNMPFYPTPEDWMKVISASEDFIKKIIPEKGVNLSILFSDCAPELRTIFWKKIEKMEELEADNIEDGIFEYSENYFDYYFFDKTPANTKSQWAKYLSKEFEVAKRLEEAWQNREYYYEIAKEKHLSVNDTVMLFVDYAFEGYDELKRED